MTASFGLFSLITRAAPEVATETLYAETIQQVRLAERTGYATAWVAEHHCTNLGQCPSPLAMLAHLAGATERIGLGSGILVLPVYERLRLIEEIVMVDMLCRGRFILGLGAGYQGHEFRRFGHDLGTARDDFLACWAAIETAYREGAVRPGAGREESVLGVGPFPRVLPPVAVAGLAGDPETQGRLAASGGRPFVALGWRPVDGGVAAREKLEASWRAAGQDPAGMALSVMEFVHVTEAPDEARDAAERALYMARMDHALRDDRARFEGGFVQPEPFEGEPTVEAILESAMIGPAALCAERLAAQLRTVRPAHVAALMAFGGLPRARVLASIARFAEEVVPAALATAGQSGQ